MRHGASNLENTRMKQYLLSIYQPDEGTPRPKSSRR